MERLSADLLLFDQQKADEAMISGWGQEIIYILLKKKTLGNLTHNADCIHQHLM